MKKRKRSHRLGHRLLRPRHRNFWRRRRSNSMKINELLRALRPLKPLGHKFQSNFDVISCSRCGMKLVGSGTIVHVVRSTCCGVYTRVNGDIVFDSIPDCNSVMVKKVHEV